MSENWLRTDEYNEPVTSLVMLEHNFSKVINDIHYWKVVIILLHNSLQGFMVCALKGTAGLEVVSKDTRKKMIAYFEDDTDEYPNECLLNFGALYNRIQNNQYLRKPFNATDDVSNSIRSLNSLRNKFIHFVPEGWSLEVSGLPIIVEHSFDIIRYLVIGDSGIYQYSDVEKERIGDLCTRILEINALVKSEYLSKNIFEEYDCPTN